MKLDGNVARLSIFSIHGWAADRDRPQGTVSVEIIQNDRLVATVPARGLRDDVLEAGLGNRRTAFWFNPFECLEYGENRFEVRFAGTRTLVPNGRATLYYDVNSGIRFAAEDPMARSKARWRCSEAEPWLTWGSVMTGDSFIDAITEHVDLAGLPERKILEVGPGYGRLLATLLRRGHAYRSYTGLELSEDRVRQLGAKYANARTRFVWGDAMSEHVETDCDLFLCAATFEHLYPNFVPTLQNVQRQLAIGAWACVDFVQLDPEMLVSEAWFETKDWGGAFVRVYARAELERLFSGCGFEIAGIASVSPGRGPGGEIINRILMCARNAGAPVATTPSPHRPPPEWPALKSRACH
jgi:SAM-dependent methyltransferase